MNGGKLHRVLVFTAPVLYVQGNQVILSFCPCREDTVHLRKTGHTLSSVCIYKQRTVFKNGSKL